MMLSTSSRRRCLFAFLLLLCFAGLSMDLSSRRLSDEIMRNLFVQETNHIENNAVFQNKSNSPEQEVVSPIDGIRIQRVDCRLLNTSISSNKNEEGMPSSSSSSSSFRFVTAGKGRVPFEMSIYPPENDKYVSGSISGRGCWECGMIDLMRQTFRQNPTSYLLDIGGNIGMMSLSAAVWGQDVFVFEPLQDNINHICRTVQRNNLHEKIRLYPYAVTRNVKRLSFILGSTVQNVGGTRVEPMKSMNISANAQEGVDYAYGIPVDSMAMHLPEVDRPVVLKIDVEGSEMDALIGGQEFFKDANIIIAFVEVRLSVMAEYDNINSLFEIFESKGLKPHMLDAHSGTAKPLKGKWSDWEKENPGMSDMFDLAWLAGKVS